MKRLCVAAFLATQLMPGSAFAAPEAFYNPATGNVTFNSDLPAVEALVLASSTGSLGSASQLLDAPGAIKLGDVMPFGYVCLISNYFEPFGLLNTGNTVVPGTPVADLRFEYLVYEGGYRVGPINVVPESSAFALSGIGLAGVALRRRSHQPSVRGRADR